MPTRFKRSLKAILPPLLWNVGKDFKRRLLRSVEHFAYAPQGWSTRLPGGANSQDYWTHFITRERATCETLMARVRAGEPILTLDEDERVKRTTFGDVLAIVARDKPHVTVLDVGGNLGDYYWIGRALVPGVALDFHCKELPAIADAGRQINPAVTFHTDDECLDRPYDLIMFSSSLQCLPDWQSVLVRAARAARDYLFLSDVPVVRVAPSYVVLQDSGGVTNLQNQLNQSEVVHAVERAGLRVVREFDMGPHPPVANAPEQATCRGWLFQRDPAGRLG